MIVKNMRWYIITVIILLSIITIPFSYSKYIETINKTITLNIGSYEKLTFFKEYNGANDFFGFDKSNIVGFKRNSTLTKEEVLQKDGVLLISNTISDGYLSKEEVYGWVENNTFYWWSSADKVYFHPKTLGAFKELLAIDTIDLTDTDTSKVENFSGWFSGDTLLTTIKGKINTSGLKYETGSNVGFADMFSKCKKLEKIDLSEFDTRNATNMRKMFYYCSSIAAFNLSNFVTNNVVTMQGMFAGCSSLRELDLKHFNTSNVTNMAELFSGCTNLRELDLSNFNTSKVTSMAVLFSGCTNLRELDLSNFVTNNVVNMQGMFAWCSSLRELDLKHFDTSKVTIMAELFSGCTNLRELDLSNFNTSKVTNMTNMFNQCNNLRELDLSNFNTSKVTNMTNMFNQCKYLANINISTFNTSKVTSMSSMFSGCSVLSILDISNFDTSSVNSMQNMFYNSAQVIVLGSNFKTSNVSNMNSMFSASDKNKTRIIYAKQDFSLSEGLTSNSMFLGSAQLKGGYGSEFETFYDENHIDASYAKLSNADQNGYLTYYNSMNEIKFNITYDLDGGTSNNKSIYYYGENYTLRAPKKDGYSFIGWTGSNGNEIENNVTISSTDTGDKHYIAHYVRNGEYAFRITGTCTFNGENANITGEDCKFNDGEVVVDYTKGKYIDTGIYLFNEENKYKDFEISFTIDSSTPHANNDTIVSSMNEAGSPWPGFVYRINTGTSKFQLRAGYSGNSNWEMPYTTKNIKITRINNILYYSIDGAAPVSTVNYTNYTESFDFPLTIGAGLDENKNPRRYFNGTISNISIKIEE